MTLRQGVLDKIVQVFKRHGGEAIDTPVFELKVSSPGSHWSGMILFKTMRIVGGLCKEFLFR